MAIAILIYLSFIVLLGDLLTIGSVGKPKRPTTPGVAAVVTFVSMVHIGLYAYLFTQI